MSKIAQIESAENKKKFSKKVNGTNGETINAAHSPDKKPNRYLNRGSLFKKPSKIATKAHKQKRPTPINILKSKTAVFAVEIQPTMFITQPKNYFSTVFFNSSIKLSIFF